MKRLLVTGSRDWTDRDMIHDVLWEAIFDLVGSTNETVMLVHGACPTGADAIANDIWETRLPEYPIDPHPADWLRFGNRAGPIRNREMVKLGADLCVAFIKDDSQGSSRTADMAEKAGIETRRYTPDMADAYEEEPV